MREKRKHWSFDIRGMATRNEKMDIVMGTGNRWRCEPAASLVVPISNAWGRVQAPEAINHRVFDGLALSASAINKLRQKCFSAAIADPRQLHHPLQICSEVAFECGSERAAALASSRQLLTGFMSKSLYQLCQTCRGNPPSYGIQTSRQDDVGRSNLAAASRKHLTVICVRIKLSCCRCCRPLRSHSSTQSAVVSSWKSL